MKRALSLGILLSIVTLVGCTSTSNTAAKPAAGSAPASAASPSSGGQQLTVRAMDTMRFEPATLTAKAGQPITITVDNGGQTLHDFSMNEGVAQPVKILAPAGQKPSGTFTIDKPGTYTFFCSQPGHQEAGMKGTLTVQ